MGPPDGYDGDDWRDGPYRSMEPITDIKIKKRTLGGLPSWLNTTILVMASFTLGGFAVNDLVKTHTVYSTKEVEKIVEVKPKCVEKASLLSDRSGSPSDITCDSAEQTIRVEVRQGLVVCTCPHDK